MNETLVTRPLAAAFVMVAAMAIIGVIDNVIPLIAAEIGLWQFHATRALVAGPLVAGLSIIGLGTLWPRRVWAVALRSLVLAISMMFYFSALALMPIAQALAGLFTSPIFILLISSLLLGERIGPWRIAAVALGFAGTLMVLQPDPSNFDAKALLPVFGGLFYAISALITRRLCGTESTVALLAGMWIALGGLGLVGVAMVTLLPPMGDGFVTRPWVWPMWDAAPWVVLQAVGSVAGVFLIIKAYQWGDPSYVSVFEYSVMIFGPGFALVAFGVPIGPLQIAGTGLIALAGVLIALRR